MEFRMRSHKYPNEKEKYIDTTFYSEEEQLLDIGYQRLRICNLKLYPQLKSLTKLFVDHNNLKELPSPETIPHLTELTCSANNLTIVPTYPKLIFLNCSRNQILDLSNYHNSKLKYFDSSYNKGFKFNFSLPECNQIYLTDCELTIIYSELIPNVELLDCGNNLIQTITPGLPLLKEIDFKNNLITKINSWPKLLRLNGDHNKIMILPTCANMIECYLSHNLLERIEDQPSLKKLIVCDNNLTSLGNMPQLQLVDVSRNILTAFTPGNNIEYASLHFNPMKTYGPINIKTAKEIQLNFECYKNVLLNYNDYIKMINVQIDPDILRERLKSHTYFSDKILAMMFSKLIKLKFTNRDSILMKLALAIYMEYYSNSKIKTVEELMATHEYINITNIINDIYYGSIIVTLYFTEQWKN
jgi:hypothetical protein